MSRETLSFAIVALLVLFGCNESRPSLLCPSGLELIGDTCSPIEAADGGVQETGMVVDSGVDGALDTVERTDADAGQSIGDSAPPADADTVPCIRQCDGRACGEDGCGGSCGTCGEAAVCSDGLCLDRPTGRRGCVEIVDCVNFCESEGCGEECVFEGTRDAQALFYAAVECIQLNCAEFAGDTEAYGDCQYERCYAELAACFEDGGI